MQDLGARVDTRANAEKEKPRPPRDGASRGTTLVPRSSTTLGTLDFRHDEVSALRLTAGETVGACLRARPDPATSHGPRAGPESVRGSGVMLFSFLDTKERQTEFALLRTLGATGGQLRGIVWFNLFLIVLCGVALGTWVGQLIGSSLLPLMEVAEEGERVTPPMAFTTDWLSLSVSYLVLAVVTVVTVVWLAWLSSKIQVQQVLRMGDAG